MIAGVTELDLLSITLEYFVFSNESRVSEDLGESVFASISITKYIPYLFYRSEVDDKIKAINYLKKDFNKDIDNYYGLLERRIKKNSKRNHLYGLYLIGDKIQKKDFVIFNIDLAKGKLNISFKLEEKNKDDVVKKFIQRLSPLILTNEKITQQEVEFELKNPFNSVFIPDAFAETIFLEPYYKKRFYIIELPKSFAFKKQTGFHYIKEGRSHRLTLKSVPAKKESFFTNIDVDEEYTRILEEIENDLLQSDEEESADSIYVKINILKIDDIDEFIHTLIAELYFYLKHYNPFLSDNYSIIFGDNYIEYLTYTLQKHASVSKTDQEPMKNTFMFPTMTYKKKCQAQRQPIVTEENPMDPRAIYFPTNEMLKDPEISDWYNRIEPKYRKKYWILCDDPSSPFVRYQSDETTTGKVFFPCCFAEEKEKGKERKTTRKNTTALNKDTGLPAGRLGRGKETMTKLDNIFQGKYELHHEGMYFSNFSFFNAVYLAVEGRNEEISTENVDGYFDFDIIANSCIQETYHMSKNRLKDIINDIRNGKKSFNSYYFYRYLEVYFNVSIFVFKYNTDIKTVDLEIPHNIYGHYRFYNPESSGVVLLWKYKHKNGRVHYEPLLTLQQKKKKYLFDTSEQKTLINLLHQKQYLINTDPQRFDFSPLSKKYRQEAVGQVVDVYGKGRGLIVERNNGRYLVHTKFPFQPYEDLIPGNEQLLPIYQALSEEITVHHKSEYEDKYFHERTANSQLPNYARLDVKEITPTTEYKEKYIVSNLLLQIYKYVMHEEYNLVGDFTQKTYRESISQYLNDFFTITKKKTKKNINILKDDFMKSKNTDEIFRVLDNTIAKNNKFIVTVKEKEYIRFFLKQTYRYEPNDMIVDFYLTEDRYITEDSYNFYVFSNPIEFENWVDYKRSLSQDTYDPSKKEPHRFLLENTVYVVQNVGENKRLAEFILQEYNVKKSNVFAGMNRTVLFDSVQYKKFKGYKEYNRYNYLKKTWEMSGYGKNGILVHGTRYAVMFNL